MTNTRRISLAILLAAASLAPIAVSRASAATTAQDLDRDSRQALQSLEQTHPFATRLAHEAKAILIFPNVVKAGFVFGGSYGEGELLSGSAVDGYYNSVTGSWGLQAGANPMGMSYF